VGRSGDRILGDSDPRGEEPAHEVRLGSVRPRGHDHASSLDRRDARQVGAERSDGALVGQLDQNVERRSPGADRLGTEGTGKAGHCGLRPERSGRQVEPDPVVVKAGGEQPAPGPETRGCA
jgi:hypothetical protein